MNEIENSYPLPKNMLPQHIEEKILKKKYRKAKDDDERGG
ncbi:predicted protein [Sclerotinia sclerotiorum 1980 UF-70]|uniref:Uncharacterized protein n=1 Tax=Sclerotinia sclerotiorum (strain ATCC 18683 / 1980 / Ss-1) TaxID=665079 RepID=A7ERR5_SCLS1|nr:predicted protein [Sclerotinia sclerotiorum 1980 UF-70]EDN92157.1 predicted protein [Sclerotinia sclerotiorum 1980 UF-70]